MSVFDISLSSSELGFGDSFSTFAFFMYGAMYQIFLGKKSDKILVNFYDPAGVLIETDDSSQMSGSDGESMN